MGQAINDAPRAGTYYTLGRFRGMPVSLARLRKARSCKACGIMLAVGRKAYRPMLGGAINGILRCDRICASCMATQGVFLKRET